MPKLEFRSNARPSMFAYPPPLEEKKREEREKVTTAVLSIAARARRREAGRGLQRESDKMEVVSTFTSSVHMHWTFFSKNVINENHQLGC